VKPLTRGQVEALADEVRSILADPDAGLSTSARLRWQGALTALEVVLGERPSLASLDDEGPN
jgi:hypothetical protein